MCTVICRWSPQEPVPVQLLALRDELASRDFDLPSNWWPSQPRVVGGRDHRGGGTWCASDLDSGVTAVILNRGDRRVAAPGAPSRGVLPLLAVARGNEWPASIELAGMAGFNLVLVGPDELIWWSFDGSELLRHSLPAGTHTFTPRGIADAALDARFDLPNAVEPLSASATEVVWPGWLPIVEEATPSTDPLALLVRIPHEGDSYETVFGQFIAAAPGALRLDYARTPDRHAGWTVARWDSKAAARGD